MFLPYFYSKSSLLQHVTVILILLLHFSAADMRAGHCAFASNSTLYIFGGKSTNNQTIHRFISLQVANTSDFENAQWNVLNDSQSFNIVNGACAITSFGKAIMLGYDDSSDSPSPGIQVYDTFADTWIGSPTDGLNVSLYLVARLQEILQIERLMFWIQHHLHGIGLKYHQINIHPSIH
jgi:hypothetical protein